MILGIGTDIVDISRIKEKITNREGFRQLVFSEGEIAYCERNKDPYQSYAARFAAKEAFLKALGTGLLITIDLHEIEVKNEDSGKPAIECSLSLSEKIKQAIGTADFNIHLSLSHTTETAVAFVIIESV